MSLAGLRLAAQHELEFYRQHHERPLNWWLHAVAVPIEWTSALLALKVLCPWPLVWAVQAAVGLIILACTQSTVLAVAQLIPAVAADAIYDHVCGTDTVSAVSAAIVAWFCSWLVQVGIGHWIIERNQPGMTKQLTWLSIVLSVSMAWDVSPPVLKS